MGRAHLRAICLFLLAFMPALAVAQVSEGFDIAITVDDLTAHGKLPRGMTRASIADAHIKTFKSHGVAEAFGFVNAGKLSSEPESEDVLRIWRKAGYPLGNHTYSHLNVDKAETLEAWQADVVAGEPVVQKYMSGADWHYFRYPNLTFGKDPSRASDALSFLKGRGYRVADVSVAFSDWNYTDAYVRCLAKGDIATIDAMKAQYLLEVDEGIIRMKAVSQRVYGRVIPQVLLTHLGGWSALMLPEVMRRLDAAGARYITLDKALSDPAYIETGGGNIMERTAKTRSISLDGIPSPKPSSDVKSLCR